MDLSGVVEAPGSEVMHRTDHIVEQVFCKKRAHFGDRVGPVIGLYSQKDVVGVDCFEGKHLGHVPPRSSRPIESSGSGSGNKGR